MYGGARRWARARPICACIYTTLVKQQMQRREIEKKKKSRHRIWLVEEKIKFCMLIHNNMGKAIENLSILCFMLHFWNGARARHLFKCSFVSQHLHLLSGFFFFHFLIHFYGGLWFFFLSLNECRQQQRWHVLIFRCTSAGYLPALYPFHCSTQLLFFQFFVVVVVASRFRTYEH